MQWLRRTDACGYLPRDGDSGILARTMHSSISCKQLLATGAAMLLLAGCASTPAPVVNHSFGPGQAAEAPVAGSSAQPANASGGVQTFGLGHANGATNAAGYTVAQGDTLYSIAFAHGIDFRTLAAQNDIAPPYTIRPGQVLKLQAAPVTGAAPAAGTLAASPAPVVAAPTPSTAVPAPSPEPAPQPSAPVFGPVTTQTMTASGVEPAGSASSATVAAAPVASGNAPTPSAMSASAPVAQPAPAPVATPTQTPSAQATRSVAGITWQWPASGKVIGGFQSGAGGDGAGVDIAGNLGDPVRAAAAGTVVYSGNGLIGYGELIIIKHNDTYLSAYGHNSKRLVKEGERVSAGQEIALMGASGAPRVELHFEVRKDGKPVDPMGFLPQR